MIVIRNVFHCKPGKAKALAEKLKASTGTMKSMGIISGVRVMTDLSATFWTVVMELEADSLEAWERSLAQYGSDPKIRESMEGYMDLVEGGRREIWRVE